MTIATRAHHFAVLLVRGDDILARRVHPATVAVEEGRIASITESDQSVNTYLLPGFVDAHVHIESSMLVPSEFAREAAGWEGDTLTVAYELLPGTGTMSDFDFGVAGNIVFGIMFVVITASTVLVRENVTGTLRRLRLKRIKTPSGTRGSTRNSAARCRPARISP